MKNTVKKPNVKPRKNRDRTIPDYSARAGQTALILAALVVSWCAIGPGTNTAQAQSPPPYPKGIWAAAGVDDDLPPELVNNLGVVGIGVNEDWNVVNPAPGVYDWTQLDSRVAHAKAAGFQYIALAVTDSSDKTPQWLLDLLPEDQKIALLDITDFHTTFCQPINTALYWNPVFHQARLDLIAAAGAHYTNDPAIVATNAATFCNHHSNDWNIQDWIGTINCPSCPQPPPTLCGDVYVDQVQQWMDAGWTEQQMLQVGKEICDAAAAAFPNQNIKLPIGGLTDNRMSTPDGDPAHGNYTQLARDIENYVYGNADLGIPPQPYANRFYMQRNVFTATWKNGDYYDTYTPPFEAEAYIKYMIRNHAKPANVGGLTPGQAGLQMITAAMLGGVNGCRLGGGPTGPCGPTCDPACVLQTALDKARTYNTDFIEIFAQDAQNPDFYDMITAATIAMGGTPREMPTPTPTPTATPILPPPTATSATDVTNSSFTANWTAVSEATGYSLDVSTVSDFSRYIGGYRKLDVGNVTSWSVTGLNEHKTFYYRVRAYDASRTSDNSNVIAATTLPDPTPTPTPTPTPAPPTPTPTPTPPLPAPTANSATNVTNSSFTANWTAVSEATGYSLDVSTVSDFTRYIGGYRKLDVGNVTSWSVTGLNEHKTYYYRVRAYDGSRMSDNSNVISVTTLSDPTPTPAPTPTPTPSPTPTPEPSPTETPTPTPEPSPTPTPTPTPTATPPTPTPTPTPTLPAPTANSATNVTNSSFTANWTAVSGATGYSLDVSTVSDFSRYIGGYRKLDVGNVTSWSVTGLNEHKTYYYRVRAYDGSRMSDNSNVIAVTTLPDPTPTPTPTPTPAPPTPTPTPTPPLPAPTATSATDVTSSSFTANWTAVSEATGYSLDVSTDSSFTRYIGGYRKLDVGNVTSWSVTGLNANKTYYYRLRAYDSSRVSDNSNVITVTTARN